MTNEELGEELDEEHARMVGDIVHELINLVLERFKDFKKYGHVNILLNVFSGTLMTIIYQATTKETRDLVFELVIAQIKKNFAVNDVLNEHGECNND
jgi:hypothetical protein